MNLLEEKIPKHTCSLEIHILRKRQDLTIKIGKSYNFLLNKFQTFKHFHIIIKYCLEKKGNKAKLRITDNQGREIKKD